MDKDCDSSIGISLRDGSSLVFPYPRLLIFRLSRSKIQNRCWRPAFVYGWAITDFMIVLHYQVARAATSSSGITQRSAFTLSVFCSRTYGSLGTQLFSNNDSACRGQYFSQEPAQMTAIQNYPLHRERQPAFCAAHPERSWIGLAMESRSHDSADPIPRFSISSGQSTEGGTKINHLLLCNVSFFPAFIILLLHVLGPLNI